MVGKVMNVGMVLYYGWLDDRFKDAAELVTGKLKFSIGDILDNIWGYIYNTIMEFVATNGVLKEITTGLFNSIDGLMSSTLAIDKDYESFEKILGMTTAIGYSLLALFFVIEFCKRTVYFENMTIEGFLKPILMLIIGKIFIGKSGWILGILADINSSLTKTILGNSLKGAANNFMVAFKSGAIVEKGLSGVIFSSGLFIVAALIVLIILLLIVLILLVRQFELTILVLFAPIMFATLVSDATNSSFKAYIKYYVAVCFQTSVMAIGMALVLDKLAVKEFTPFVGDFLGVDLIYKTMMLVILGLFILKAKSFLTKILG